MFTISLSNKTKTQIQIEVEHLLNKKQKNDLLVEEVSNIPEIAELLENKKINKDDLFVLGNLAYMKRVGMSMFISILSCKKYEHALYISSVIKLFKLNLLGLDFINSINEVYVYTYIELDKNLVTDIDNFKFLPPMIVEPDVLFENSDSGYLTTENDSVLLNNTHHDEDVCLEHLDEMNSIPFMIDPRVIDVISDSQDGIDQRKPNETVKQFTMRVDNFKTLQEETKKVINYLIESGNKFYFTHKYDYRGRFYSIGYVINYQGNDYRKAMLNLHYKEEVIEQNYKELLIDLANAYGLDNQTYDVRLAAFENTSLNQKIDMAKDAENKPQYMACIQAIKDYIIRKPSGYLCSRDATASGYQMIAMLLGCAKTAKLCNIIPDGTRQDNYTIVYNEIKNVFDSLDINYKNLERKVIKKCLIACAYGSTKAPKNLFGSDTVELNVFYAVLNKLCPAIQFLNETFLNLWDENLLEYSYKMPDGFTVKKTVTEKGSYELDVPELNTTLTLNYKENKPVRQSRELAANITHSTDAYVAREVIRRCSYDVDVVKKAIKNLETYMPFFGIKEFTNGSVFTEFNELYKQTKIVSVRLVQYINEDGSNLVYLNKIVAMKLLNTLRKMVKYEPFQVICVHDNFKAHANHIGEVNNIYQDLLLEILDGSLFEYFVQVFSGKKINKVKLSNDIEINNMREILRNKEAIYALT